MKKILAFLFAVSLFYFVGAQSVLASSLFNVEVRTYLDGSNMNQAASGLVDQARGSKVQFNASGISPEYTFAFYAVNDIVRDDLPQNYEFVVRSNMKITAFFRPNGSVTPANARHVVIFADNNGKIIADGIQYVADGGTATEPSVLPTKPNATYATQKWFTPQGESSLENITSSRVYLLQYVSSDNTAYTVNVTGGSVVEDAPFNYNDVVTLVPNAAPAEQVFSHWEDAEGNVLSTKANYKFTVMGNVSVQAVFAASPEFSGAVVNMSDALSIRSGYVTYKGQFDLPAGFTLVEYGFIFSRSSDVLTLDSLGATIVPSNVHNGQTGEFLRSFPNDTFNSVRAYLIVKNASNLEQIVYSDYYWANQETVIYETGFESSEGFTAGSVYNNSTPILRGPSGQQWSFYYGTPSTTSPLSGAQSAQMRIYSGGSQRGYAEMNFDVQDAIRMTFVAANTSNIDVVVSHSTNGGVSYSQGSMYKLSAISKSFDYFVNETGNIRFKFTLSSANTTTTERLYIDNVKIFSNTSIAKHEVVYNNTTEPIGYIANNSTIMQSSPTQNGYSFAGWFTDAALTQSYNASTPVVQSLQLYAKWTINEYTISFDSNEGSAVGAITQEYNTSVIEPSEPTRTGYTFAGWYTDDNTFLNEYVFTTMPSSNLTLFAKWDVNNYIISFDSNGGSDVSPITQAFGTSVSAPSAPLKSGYEFVGWFSDVELTSAYTFSTMPAQNITLYAKWDVFAGETFSVQFNVNGGSPSIDSQVIPENSTALEPADPTKEGYRFIEWQLEGEPFNFATPITGDITLIALWIQQFTVTFDVDGGSAVTAQVVDSGSLASQPNPSPTKSGNSFAGWFTTSVKDVSFNFATITITENTTIYAKWNPAVYATDLFISEYVEGSGTIRAIEIYNGTGSNVNLSNYRLVNYYNGNSSVGSTYIVNLSGTLSHNQVAVIYYTPGASTALITAANTASITISNDTAMMNFNGDDAISLEKNISSVWTKIDVIGQIGTDPGTAWTNNSVSTANMTLVRKPEVINGDSDGSNAFDPSIQWNAYAQDTFSYLGSHTANVSNP